MGSARPSVAPRGGVFQPDAGEALFAATTPGLEEALAGEVRALGHAPTPTVEPGGVGWAAPAGGHQEANLWLRTANRIWLRVQTLKAGKGTGWLQALRRERLAPFVKPGGAAHVEVEGSGEQTGRLEGELRAALALPPARLDDAPQLQLRISRGEATLSVDTSGELLFRRGYRQEVSRAPLRETLAAGLLALAGHKVDAPFWDGLCGSGTLPIEAALRAKGQAPGVSRPFAFQGWPSFDAPRWEERVARARAGETRLAPGLIRASDLNAGSLGTARRNARRAGVLETLTLQRQDVATFRRPPDSSAGLWLSNLPYGRRIEGDLRALYRAVAATWRRELPDWTLALLVEDTGLLEDAVGSSPSARFPVSNGGLRCELLVWYAS